MISMDFSREEDQRQRRNTRRDHDAYMTPAPLATAIVASLGKLSPRKIIDPSCGDGEFVRAARAQWPDASIAAIDIRAEVSEKITEFQGVKFINRDYLSIPASLLGDADLIVTNPPFAYFHDFVQHALTGMKESAWLALLMRLNMLVGSKGAQDRWIVPMENGLTPIRQLCSTFPIHPRPSFTGIGTDSTEYALGLWCKGFDNGGVFDPIKWDKPVGPKRGRKPRAVASQNGGDPFAG